MGFPLASWEVQSDWLGLKNVLSQLLERLVLFPVESCS